MKIIQNHIVEVFSKAIQKSYPSLTHEYASSISKSNPSFGDYQWNGAMSIYKNHKDELKLDNALQVAESVSKNISTDMFEKINPTKGFVSVKLAPNWISNELKKLLKNKVSIEGLDKQAKVLVDFSSPNIAKEMHVGHLRSTILGESICRLFEFVGYNVLRINHLGDWGTHFGMYVEYLKREYPDYAVNRPTITDLTKFYQKAKVLMEEDEDFKKSSWENVVSLQKGDRDCLKAWEIICDISKREIRKLYERLDITLEDFGESYYNDMIPGVIEELTEKGICVESEGAQCVFTSVSETPLILRRSYGGYGYDSTDIACIRHRIIDLKCDRLIYVTDSGQRTHFEMIFEAARKAGWAGDNISLEHIGFGLILNEDGKRFKTRSGESVKLIELLDEAVRVSRQELETRGIYDESYIEYASNVIGHASVKYFDLKQNYATNYKFAYDKMLDPKGNSAVYILYGYARICSIFRKCTAEWSDKDDLRLEHPSELALATHLLRFPDIIASTLQSLMISRIAEYTFNATELFTTFYNECKVVGDENEVSRLLLCKATRDILDVCLHILGITPLEKL